MNYLNSYLIATKEHSSSVFKTHTLIFWIITITYSTSLIFVTIMTYIDTSKATKIKIDWYGY